MFRGPQTARARRAGLSLTLPLAFAAALAGCGSSGNGVASKSAGEILSASTAAAEGATSAHLVSKTSEGPLSFASDQELSENEARARLSYLGLAFEAIRIGNTLYVKGNPAFYQRLAGIATTKIPANTWLKAPAGSGRLAQLTAFTQLSGELARTLPTGRSSRGAIVTLTKGGTATVNGQQAVELKETTTRYTATMYVATTGKPYPIQIVKRGKENGQTTFSDWNEPVTVSAPANAVELSELERKGR